MEPAWRSATAETRESRDHLTGKQPMRSPVGVIDPNFIRPKLAAECSNTMFFSYKKQQKSSSKFSLVCSGIIITKFSLRKVLVLENKSSVTTEVLPS